MKKIFIITASVILSLILVFIVVLSCLKREVKFEFDDPIKIVVYNKSVNSKASYEKTTENYGVVLEKIRKMTKITYFDAITKIKSTDTKIYQDSESKYSTWSSNSMKSNNIVVEMKFDSAQDLIVYYKGNEKTISYYFLAFVFSEESYYDEIVVYFSTSNSETENQTSYASNSPLILKGNTKEIIEYIKSL